MVIEVDEDSDAYYTSHIPGAIALDWRADLQDPLRRDFVDRAGFEACSRRGASPPRTR
ncbi:hypothetical protein [Geodermatophilus sabuli]|uniref:hypothetical protein n=1 Tax=Geodermatophilus sabuli TaxID=1564158 RepID=UPI0017D5CA82|nr:hypothetical protein [Geodermatophilus sabuli]MBB3086281.1 3-mercaptopyruvate sulfurtransferase SseA [Geodermatophilus sabuli]